jgi:DNA-binding transcriptional ArsR family regulator/uncharacterized protein YndB with AHSA1/START domain
MSAGADARVWKALASPVRRRVLDLLRRRRRTTGDLAAAFPALSRFAVMQHLAVLTRARLVLVRREGRQRFNHLNPAPLRQVHERWVSRYADPLAAAALDLKRHAELPEGDDPMATKTAATKRVGRSDNASTSPAFNLVRVELEVPIAAPPGRVWQALVEQTTQWWRRDFYVGKAARAFVIEPRPGGRMYEDWGDGAGMVWMNVIEVDPPRVLQLAGHLTAAFGGPANTHLRLTLESRGKGGTLLRLSEHAFGRVDDKMKAELHQGWTLLLAKGLKPFIESGA